MQDHLPLVLSLPIYCHPSSCLLNSLNFPHHHSSPRFGDSVISQVGDFHLLWFSLLHSLLLSRVILLCILFWVEIELVRTVGRYCCCVVHNAQSLVPYLSLSLSLLGSRVALFGPFLDGLRCESLSINSSDHFPCITLPPRLASYDRSVTTNFIL